MLNGMKNLWKIASATVNPKFFAIASFVKVAKKIYNYLESFQQCFSIQGDTKTQRIHPISPRKTQGEEWKNTHLAPEYVEWIKCKIQSKEWLNFEISSQI